MLEYIDFSSLCFYVCCGVCVDDGAGQVTGTSIVESNIVLVLEHIGNGPFE